VQFGLHFLCVSPVVAPQNTVNVFVHSVTKVNTSHRFKNEFEVLFRIGIFLGAFPHFLFQRYWWKVWCVRLSQHSKCKKILSNHFPVLLWLVLPPSGSANGGGWGLPAPGWTFLGRQFVDQN